MPGGSGGQTQKTSPWAQAIPYLTGDRGVNKWGENYDIQGILPMAYQMYQQNPDGMTPQQQAFQQTVQNDQMNDYASIFNDSASDPTNQAQNLYGLMSAGAFTPKPAKVGGSINVPMIDAAQNEFQPNAQATQWNAATVDPNSVQNMQSAKVGGAPQAAQVGNMAQMNAAQNQGYTPTGQVAEFMRGGAYNNEHLDKMYDSAARKVGQQFNEQIMSGITDNAVANGGFGGSRQGIAEGIAARGASDTLGDIAANMYGNAYNRGFDAMSNLTSQQMAGGINQAAQNAGFQQGANQNNAAWQNQGLLQNVANQQQAQGWQNQNNLAQAGFDQQANAANAGYGNQAIFGNQGYQNQANQSNAGAQNQFSLANQGLGFNAATQNTNNQQNTNTQNVANNMLGQYQNAGLTLQDNNQAMNWGQTNLQNQLGAFGALGLGTNLQNQMFGNIMQNMGLPEQQQWNQLQNLQNFVYPVAGAGGSTTQSGGSNPFAAGVGGALTGAQLGNFFGSPGIGAGLGGVAGLLGYM